MLCFNLTRRTGLERSWRIITTSKRDVTYQEYSISKFTQKDIIKCQWSNNISYEMNEQILKMIWK